MSTTSALRNVRTFRPRLTVRGLLDSLAGSDARYRARVAAARLDEHLLRDIGISRAELGAALARR